MMGEMARLILNLVPVHHLFGKGWFYFLFYSDQDCGFHAVTLSWSKFGIWRCLFCGRRKTGELWETPLEQGKNQQETQPMYGTMPKSNLSCVGGRWTMSPQSTVVLGLQQQLTAPPSLKLMITWTKSLFPYSCTSLNTLISDFSNQIFLYPGGQWSAMADGHKFFFCRLENQDSTVCSISCKNNIARLHQHQHAAQFIKYNYF